MKNIQSMRKNYEEKGVEGFYKENSDEYSNLYESQIKELLVKNISKFDCNCVLDLCCGGGEVTKVLLENSINNISGADPYTYELYTKNTGKKCISISFKDILNGKLDKNYTMIICSFALHLANEKDLFMIINELFRHTKLIIIISPHKRPFLDRITKTKLMFSDYSLTSKGKKVYLRAYSQSNWMARKFRSMVFRKPYHWGNERYQKYLKENKLFRSSKELENSQSD